MANGKCNVKKVTRWALGLSLTRDPPKICVVPLRGEAGRFFYQPLCIPGYRAPGGTPRRLRPPCGQRKSLGRETQGPGKLCVF